MQNIKGTTPLKINSEKIFNKNMMPFHSVITSNGEL